MLIGQFLTWLVQDTSHVTENINVVTEKKMWTITHFQEEEQDYLNKLYNHNSYYLENYITYNCFAQNSAGFHENSMGGTFPNILLECCTE